MDRKTIHKYLAPAIAAGFSPGQASARTSVQWRELVAGAGRRATAAGDLAEIEAHRDYMSTSSRQG